MKTILYLINLATSKVLDSFEGEDGDDVVPPDIEDAAQKAAADETGEAHVVARGEVFFQSDRPGRPTGEPSCKVYVDGNPVMVPSKSCCMRSARGSLGLLRGQAVARELGETAEPDGVAISLVAGFEFHEGDRFVTGGIELAGGNLKGPFPLGDPAQPWERDPDGWKGE